MTPTKPKVLVTGGAGFIGSHLVRRLVQEGHEVRIIDKKPISDARRKLPDVLHGLISGIHNEQRKSSRFKNNVHYHQFDIIPKGDEFEPIPEDIMENVDTIFHLAAKRSVPESQIIPNAFFDANIKGMHRLLESAKEHGVRRFVFSSSSSVYGGRTNSENLQSENMDPAENSIYAFTKVDGERLCAMYQRMGVACVSLRYFNVYGPSQLLERAAVAAVVPIFITQALKGQPLHLHSDGAQSRDFTFVDDVVRANILAMKAEGFGDYLLPPIFNVGSGNNYTIKNLAELILQETGSSSELVIDGEPRQGDVRSSRACPRNAQRFLGFTAEVSLGEGIRRTVEYAKAEYAAGRVPFS